jgi:hypothetical protein
MSSKERKTIDDYSSSMMDPGSKIASYLSAKERKTARMSSKSMNELLQSDNAERIYLNCPNKDNADQYDPSIYGGPLEFRIEMDAEEGHMDCLGAIYRLFEDKRKSVLYQLPYDDVDKLQEFMKFSGIDPHQIIQYISLSEELYTYPSLEVMTFLAKSVDGNVDSDFVRIYMDLEPSKETLKSFIRLVVPKLHGYDFVALIESLETRYDMIAEACKYTDDDGVESITTLGIREEREEMIDIVMKRVTPKILKDVFTQANYTYYNDDDNDFRDVLKRLYKGHPLLKHLKDEPSFPE